LSPSPFGQERGGPVEERAEWLNRSIDVPDPFMIGCGNHLQPMLAFSAVPKEESI
jgi:hypothetical protein